MNVACTKSVSFAIPSDTQGNKETMESQHEELKSCEQVLSSCDEAFDSCALNGVDTIVSSFLKNITDDYSLYTLDECSLCTVETVDDGFSEDCCGADGTLCTEVDFESLSEREREDDIVDDIVVDRWGTDSILCNDVANALTVEAKDEGIREDCCGADGTEVERSVMEVCCRVEGRSNDESRNDIVDTVKVGIPDVRCVMDDQSSLVDTDSTDDENENTQNDQNNIANTKASVDDDEYDIYKDIYCNETDTFESEYEFDKQNALPLKERRFRTTEKKNKKTSDRQNSKALKRQQSSIRLQQRLEKIYYREKMIRDLDVKLAAWKNPKKKNTKYDEISVSDSMSLHSVKTGLEVIHMEF
mmetsp:Transcript_13453/g.27844  ORF Transcript_13453/g.27844 Transcript_13453/m.27844 type:complete len:358 (-) Transcript_13453:183-1256(-)